ncbi:uncharacterized protein [Dermacentor albipictus]|uniref:uncharacterized protein n=1 Tax=Dermacentor albipictus TaxID=60249 RepID=UPI0038FCD02F
MLQPKGAAHHSTGTARQSRSCPKKNIRGPFNSASLTIRLTFFVAVLPTPQAAYLLPVVEEVEDKVTREGERRFEAQLGNSWTQPANTGDLLAWTEGPRRSHSPVDPDTPCTGAVPADAVPSWEMCSGAARVIPASSRRRGALAMSKPATPLAEAAGLRYPRRPFCSDNEVKCLLEQHRARGVHGTHNMWHCAGLYTE